MPNPLKILVLLALTSVLLVAQSAGAIAVPSCAMIQTAPGELAICPNGNEFGIGATTGSPGQSNTGPGYAGVQAPSDAQGGTVAGVPACVPGVDEEGNPTHCLTPLPVPPSDGGGGGAPVDVAAVAASAAASIRVPDPTLVVGPDPSNNRWGVLAVGLPIWIWAEDQGVVSTTVHDQGIDISITATRGSVTIDWDDGAVVQCRSMTPRRPTTDPMMKSPDCGHVYMHPGDYNISGQASWDVRWQALDQSGTLTLVSSGSYLLPIRNFSSVVIG